MIWNAQRVCPPECKETDIDSASRRGYSLGYIFALERYKAGTQCSTLRAYAQDVLKPWRDDARTIQPLSPNVPKFPDALMDDVMGGYPGLKVSPPPSQRVTCEGSLIEVCSRESDCTIALAESGFRRAYVIGWLDCVDLLNTETPATVGEFVKVIQAYRFNPSKYANQLPDFHTWKASKVSDGAYPKTHRVTFRLDDKSYVWGDIVLAQPKGFYHFGYRLKNYILTARALDQAQFEFDQIVRLCAIQDALGARISNAKYPRPKWTDHLVTLQIGPNAPFGLDSPYMKSEFEPDDVLESIWLNREADYYWPNKTYPRLSRPKNSTADIKAIAETLNALSIGQIKLNPL